MKVELIILIVLIFTIFSESKSFKSTFYPKSLRFQSRNSLFYHSFPKIQNISKSEFSSTIIPPLLLTKFFDSSNIFLKQLISTYKSNELFQTFLLIFLSELGDKSFFLSAILAAKYGPLMSLIGSIFALASMSTLSSFVGFGLNQISLPFQYLPHEFPFQSLISCLVFSSFGLKSISDYITSKSRNRIFEEKQEAEKLIRETFQNESLLPNSSLPSSLQDDSHPQLPSPFVLSPPPPPRRGWKLFLEIFWVVFAAEIGDRSSLSTMALSGGRGRGGQTMYGGIKGTGSFSPILSHFFSFLSHPSQTTFNQLYSSFSLTSFTFKDSPFPFSVILGALLAQSLSSVIAVLSGEVASQFLSEEALSLTSGALFLVFALPHAWKLIGK